MRAFSAGLMQWAHFHSFFESQNNSSLFFAHSLHRALLLVVTGHTAFYGDREG
ncbi:MAG TPA: hypothetical protein VD948_11370 [Rhodothermales bacterium]|nr:hypothetical protein [Rhodothermales bacterium]